MVRQIPADLGHIRRKRTLKPIELLVDSSLGRDTLFLNPYKDPVEIQWVKDSLPKTSTRNPGIFRFSPANE